MSTNEIALQNDSTVTTVEQNTAASQLMQHAQAMQTAYDVAKAMCSSDLVPAIYKGKPENGAAAILYGAELGLNPIQSLQQIFVVKGNPAIYARTMVALLKSKGHRVWTEETSDTSVTVCGQLNGDDHVERSTWSIDRAKKAGYTSNTKYQSDPQAMLFAKAASEVCRKIAPDILLGIAYSREELEMEPRSVRVQSERVPSAPVTASEILGTKPVGAEPEATDVSNLPEADEQPVADPKIASKSAPEAALSGDEGADTPQADEESKITAAQLKKLHAMLGEVGLGGATKRDEALAWMSNVLELPNDAPLTSSKDLTATEADRIFAELDKAIGGEA